MITEIGDIFSSLSRRFGGRELGDKVLGWQTRLTD